MSQKNKDEKLRLYELANLSVAFHEMHRKSGSTLHSYEQLRFDLLEQLVEYILHRDGEKAFIADEITTEGCAGEILQACSEETLLRKPIVITSSPTWISVTESLPMDEERILVAYGNGVYEDFIWTGQWNEFPPPLEDNLFWMPLPPPPKSLEDENE